MTEEDKRILRAALMIAVETAVTNVVGYSGEDGVLRLVEPEDILQAGERAGIL